jgi:hypothetical protein
MVLAFFVIIIRRKYDQSQDFEKDGPKSLEQNDHSKVELFEKDYFLSHKNKNFIFSNEDIRFEIFHTCGPCS